MKVKKLIELLSNMNPDADVRVHMKYGNAVLALNSYVGADNVCWIETEDDFDVEEELKALLQYYAENGVDEADGYQEMIDLGFTPGVVYEYLGEEAAQHMRRVCYAHGVRW